MDCGVPLHAGDTENGMVKTHGTLPAHLTRGTDLQPGGFLTPCLVPAYQARRGYANSPPTKERFGLAKNQDPALILLHGQDRDLPSLPFAT
jgi:hypothetical protein